MAPKTVQIPVAVTSATDINRLLREIEAIDEQLIQLRVRKPGSEVKLPKTSLLMEQMAELNKLNLLQPADRLRLQQILKALQQRAPILHMSFSADPSAEFMATLVTWLRREIHPFVLVTVGLEPTIGAGCIVRTANRVFDFSLAQNFAKQRDMLIAKLVPPTPADAQPASAPPPEQTPAITSPSITSPQTAASPAIPTSAAPKQEVTQ